MGILVEGLVESKSKKGNSIKVGGEWYGTFNASDLPAEWKDYVTFEYQMDKTGRYRNIVKGTVKVSGSASASATQSGPVGGRKFSNLGVELGHASNLAMRVTENMGLTHGTPEFWKEFVGQTDTAYKIMKSLRARYEAEENAPIEPAAPEEEEVVVAGKASPESDASDVSIEDLF